MSDTPGSLSPSERYINRELSWLAFNERVLGEAARSDKPLLERVKFLAIFESNLDEFYMVRVSGLIEQVENGLTEATPDGLTPRQQLRAIAKMAAPLRQRANEIWKKSLKPALAKGAGITFQAWDDLTKQEQKGLSEYFEEAVFRLCTPLMLRPSITFPFISNRSLNLAVELGPADDPKLARVKLPPVLPRAVPIPGREQAFLLMEDLITAHLDRLFPGVQIRGAHLFRVIRDADIEIRELEAADLIDAVEKSLKMRRFGDPVLLEYQPGLSGTSLRDLLAGLQLPGQSTFRVNGLIGLDVMWELAKIDSAEHHEKPAKPYLHPALKDSQGIFDAIRQGPILLHHPFDSFHPVEEFVRAAAEDPQVIGIKQTLYRVGAQSPVVESLLAAAEAGKQVAAMVELKARFDESNNLVWSRALERAGVHVTYGFPAMKTHCKLCLVVRKEQDGIRSYAHVATGNYNPSTARLYTDVGLFTDDPAITQDITELFNFLTGFSKQEEYRKLLVAPISLRDQVIEKIHREIAHHRKGRNAQIVFKLNSLVDPEVIDALYKASQEGVKVDLVIRGICCLRPGVKGMSENIRVVSIVGRFLEHSRIYYFANGGEPEAYIGSADMMRRNLDRRIEALVPVESPDHIQHLHDVILMPSFKDNQQAWRMNGNGEYARRQAKKKEKAFNLQEWLMEYPATQMLDGGADWTA